jgi:hypothetical protein
MYYTLIFAAEAYPLILKELQFALLDLTVEL